MICTNDLLAYPAVMFNMTVTSGLDSHEAKPVFDEVDVSARDGVLLRNDAIGSCNYRIGPGIARLRRRHEDMSIIYSPSSPDGTSPVVKEKAKVNATAITL